MSAEDLWDGIAVKPENVEIPPQVGTIERVYPEFRMDSESGEPILESDGSRSRNMVFEIKIPGVTDTWENGVKYQRFRVNSESWRTFLEKVLESGFVLESSPTELVGESFELEAEDRRWTRRDGTPARWVIHWPVKHLPPE